MDEILRCLAAGHPDSFKLSLGLMLDASQPGHPDNPSKRSAHWPAARAAHLKKQPVCCISGLAHDLDVHHAQPFHEKPELELEESNLRTVFRPLHFVVAHLCNWKSWNAAFDETVAHLRQLISQRP